MTRHLNINLADILEQKFPGGFHVPVDVDISNFLEFGDDDWDHPVDVDSALATEDQVALIWSVADVLARRADLSDEQAWQVLTTARDDYMRNGCHLDFLEATANGLFPVGGYARERLRSRLAVLLRTIESLPDEQLADPAAVGAVVSQIDHLESAVVATRSTTTIKGVTA